MANTISVEGKCTVHIYYQGRKHQYKFYVTSCNNSPTLLLCESSTAIGLVATLFQIKEIYGTPEYIPKQQQQNPSMPQPSTQGRVPLNVSATSTHSTKAPFNPNCPYPHQSQISL